MLIVHLVNHQIKIVFYLSHLIYYLSISIYSFTNFQEEHRARDLFYALWIPDLFMDRVKSNSQWSLFCPSEAPGLAECWGNEFENLYTKYEREVELFQKIQVLNVDITYVYCWLHLMQFQGKARKVVAAQNLWFEILKSQIETGTPFMVFKVLIGIIHDNKMNAVHLAFVCILRIPATERAINRIWEQSSPQTYVLKSLSSQAQLKLLCAIWHLSPCHGL